MRRLEELRQLALELAPEVAAYCARPDVRHELGLVGETGVAAELTGLGQHTLSFRVATRDGRRWIAQLAIGSPAERSTAKQIAYEALLLRALALRGIAPEVCYVDATLYHLRYGVLIRDEVVGRPLDLAHAADVAAVAQTLAILHTTTVPEDLSGSFEPLDAGATSLASDVAQATELIGAYASSAVAEKETAALLLQSLQTAEARLAETMPQPSRQLTHGAVSSVTCWVDRPQGVLAGALALVRSEANRRARMIGWEYARFDEPARDLAAVLAGRAVEKVGNVPEQAIQDALVAAYLDARPTIDAAQLRERVAKRLPFASLLVLARAVANRAWGTLGHSQGSTAMDMIGSVLDPGVVKVWLRDR